MIRRAASRPLHRVLVTRTYGFDADSNLTTLPDGAAATYDKASELTSSTLSGTTTNYAYNTDGQRLSARDPAPSPPGLGMALGSLPLTIIRQPI